MIDGVRRIGMDCVVGTDMDFASIPSACDFFRPFLKGDCPKDAISVVDVLRTMEEHALTRDPALQDRFARIEEPRRRSERDRRLVWVENQRTHYCFVSAEDGGLGAPVYFASSLDLVDDCGIERAAVLADGTCLIASSFANFFWFAMGASIALRSERSDALEPAVSGIVFAEPLDRPGGEFINPLVRAFPGGRTVYVSPGVICVPDWGVAFSDAERRSDFVDRYGPSIASEW